MTMRRLAMGCLTIGLLSACHPSRPTGSEPPLDSTALVVNWLASFDAQAPAAYAAPLASGFSYEGPVVGSDTHPWTFSRDMDVSATRRAFERGHFESWRTRVLHQAGTEVVSEVRFTYVTAYDKAQPNWSLRCEVITRLLVTLDPTGRSIARVREALPPSREGGTYATLAFVKFLNIEPSQIRTSSHSIPGGEVRDDAYLAGTRGVAFTVRSTTKDTRSPTGMLVGESSVEVLDARGRRVLNCESGD